MLVDDPLNNGQTYTCPLKFIIGMKPLKYAKELMHVVHIKPGAVITYAKDYLVMLHRRTYPNVRSVCFGGILDGIGQQVDHNTCHQGCISQHRV